MQFKPTNTRTLVLKGGNVNESFRFKITGTIIPSLKEKRVKFLGKIFHANLKDSDFTQICFTGLELMLNQLDKTGLPGRFKAWIYQYAVLPKILW